MSDLFSLIAQAGSNPYEKIPTLGQAERNNLRGNNLWGQAGMALS
jgi:hypothetical protein